MYKYIKFLFLTGFTKISTIILSVFVSRIYGVDIFSEYILGLSVVVGLSVLTTLGSFNTIIRLGSSLEIDKSQFTYVYFTCVKICSISLFIVCSLFYLLSLNIIDSISQNNVIIIAFSLIFITFDNLFQSLLFSKGHHDIISRNNFYSSILTLCFFVLNFYLELLDVIYLIFVQYLFLVFFNFISSFTYLVEILDVYKNDRKKISFFNRYMLPSFLSTIFVYPVFTLMQVHASESGIDRTQVAINGLSLQWYNLVIFLPQAFGNIFLRDFTIDPSIKKLTKYFLITSLATSFFVIIILQAFDIIILIYDFRFKSDFFTFKAMLFAAVINAGLIVFGQFVLARGKYWFGYIINSFWAALVFVTTLLAYNYSWVDKFALPLLLSFVIVFFIQLFYICNLRDNKHEDIY